MKVKEKRRRGGDISTLLLWALQAPQVNGEWNFKTLHLHELDRPLENTRATVEKASFRNKEEEKW